MRKPLICLLFLALSTVANASLVVWDPGLAAQNAGNEVVNFAKWAKTELDATNIELNTLHQYETEILQLARMGDPSALRALPGISTVAQLESVATQLQSDYAAWKNFANPQHFQADMNSILSAYERPTWN